VERFVKKENGHKEKILWNADNQWTAATIPWFIKHFDCHVNVEVVGFVTAVKYLFKYIYKGHDSALLQFFKGDNATTIYDETAKYEELRYVIFLNDKIYLHKK
jgi:hypothetical protein